MIVTFYEPYDKTLGPFSDLFEKVIQTHAFEGLLMVCSHIDGEGEYLKKSLDYLGEIQQLIVVKNLPSLPKVVLVNNEIDTGLDIDFSPLSFQFADPILKQAKMFAKRTLKCEAFKINQFEFDAEKL